MREKRILMTNAPIASDSPSSPPTPNSRRGRRSTTTSWAADRLGGPTFIDGRLVFAGEINTDGGGFSSLRLPLDPGALSGFGQVRFRARPDDRGYMVTFDDSVPARDRRVSHRAPLEFGNSGEWQTVSVAFSELFPAIFGQRIDDLPFDKKLATRMGIMISDGRDGPFQLEIDWIEICP